jgi:hypothetical protein
MTELIPRGRRAIVLAGVVALLTLVGLASSAQPAAAKEVFFDPDTPAGKEYALPVDQAREEATGDGADESSGAGAPLFGAGVPPRGAGTGAAGAETGLTSHPQGQGPGGQPNGNARKTEPHGDSANPGQTVRVAAAGGSYPLTSGVGIVAAIMLVGAALGLGLRTLQRSNR